jgi:head-tail adaptor
VRRNIKAGDLRELFELARPVTAQDDTGAETITWSAERVWGFREPLSGKEWAQQGMLVDGADSRITIRHNPRWVPNARWRFVGVDDGQVYDVKSVQVHSTLALVETMVRSSTGDRDGR